jgi:hypothetical protein
MLGELSVRLWVRNLTDTHYYDSLVTFPTTGVSQRPAAPRRFGISVGDAFQSTPRPGTQAPDVLGFADRLAYRSFEQRGLASGGIGAARKPRALR